MEAGQDPASFWRLTYREIAIILKGASARIVREQDGRAWLAWHVEALSRTKKLPKLEKMLSQRKTSRRKTADEMVAMAHLWTAATRGR